MTAPQPQPTYSPIHPATHVGLVSLTVADLERSILFYEGAIGLLPLARSENSVTFGAPGAPMLVLTEQPGALAWPREGTGYTGLYHFAILLPSRRDLGRWLSHWLGSDMPMPGQGDHAVSEALYIEDPDGHGVEMYSDRRRDEWQWEDGRVRMVSDPVDIHGLLNEAAISAEPWTGAPVGTRIGHIHLQVRDIPATAAFYRDILGFDIVAEMPSALFMSAGGYHHHIGANVWHSRGVGPAPVDSVNLQSYTIDLPDEAARAAVLERIDAAGIATTTTAAGVEVDDPSGITIVLRVVEPAV